MPRTVATSPHLDLDHFADISEMVFDTLFAAEKGQFYLTKKFNISYRLLNELLADA
jgi:hypothetical protein